MDSLITAAARALATGDPLGALNRVALRDDAPALALRGLAMAQLGDFERAKILLKSAAQSFGAKEPVARARCIVAEAEIALASRDLSWPTKTLDAARDVLERHGDRMNAEHAHALAIRRLILIGRLDDAEQALRERDLGSFPPALRAAHDLAIAGLAMRRVQTTPAREALARANRAARESRIPALIAEVETAARILVAPAARAIAQGKMEALRLSAVETLLNSDALVVDACRYVVREKDEHVSLATRPVLFALARALAEVWPGDVSRDDLVRVAFGGKEADESHRARLRVEIGRLREIMKLFADIIATPSGFTLAPNNARDVVVLARPLEEKHGEVLALLADGEAWSSSALALALDTSQRSVQRSLDALLDGGRVQAFGRGRARRWMAPPIAGFTTVLLLPAASPSD